MVISGFTQVIEKTGQRQDTASRDEMFLAVAVIGKVDAAHAA